MLTPSQDAIRALTLPTICRSKTAGTGWPAEPKKIAASTPLSLMATRSIVAGMQGSIWRIDPASGDATELTYNQRYHNSPTISPDGNDSTSETV